MQLELVKKHTSLLWLIVFGFLVRLLVFNLPGFKIDVMHGMLGHCGFMRLDFQTFIHPLFGQIILPDFYMFFIFWHILLTFGICRQPNFYELLKLPAIIAEVILGILFINSLKILQKNLLVFPLATIFVMFNPSFIFNSSVGDK